MERSSRNGKNSDKSGNNPKAKPELKRRWLKDRYQRISHPDLWSQVKTDLPKNALVAPDRYGELHQRVEQKKQNKESETFRETFDNHVQLIVENIKTESRCEKQIAYARINELIQDFQLKDFRTKDVPGFNIFTAKVKQFSYRILQCSVGALDVYKRKEINSKLHKYTEIKEKFRDISPASSLEKRNLPTNYSTRNYEMPSFSHLTLKDLEIFAKNSRPNDESPVTLNEIKKAGKELKQDIQTLLKYREMEQGIQAIEISHQIKQASEPQSPTAHQDSVQDKLDNLIGTYLKQHKEVIKNVSKIQDNQAFSTLMETIQGRQNRKGERLINEPQWADFTKPFEHTYRRPTGVGTPLDMVANSIKNHKYLRNLEPLVRTRARTAAFLATLPVTAPSAVSLGLGATGVIAGTSPLWGTGLAIYRRKEIGKYIKDGALAGYNREKLRMLKIQGMYNDRKQKLQASTNELKKKKLEISNIKLEISNIKLEIRQNRNKIIEAKLKNNKMPQYDSINLSLQKNIESLEKQKFQLKEEYKQLFRKYQMQRMGLGSRAETLRPPKSIVEPDPNRRTWEKIRSCWETLTDRLKKPSKTLKKVPKAESSVGDDKTKGESLAISSGADRDLSTNKSRDRHTQRVTAPFASLDTSKLVKWEIGTNTGSDHIDSSADEDPGRSPQGEASHASRRPREETRHVASVTTDTSSSIRSGESTQKYFLSTDGGMQASKHIEEEIQEEVEDKGRGSNSESHYGTALDITEGRANTKETEYHKQTFETKEVHTQESLATLVEHNAKAVFSGKSVTELLEIAKNVLLERQKRPEFSSKLEAIKGDLKNEDVDLLKNLHRSSYEALLIISDEIFKDLRSKPVDYQSKDAFRTHIRNILRDKNADALKDLRGKFEIFTEKQNSITNDSPKQSILHALAFDYNIETVSTAPSDFQYEVISTIKDEIDKEYQNRKFNLLPISCAKNFLWENIISRISLSPKETWEACISHSKDIPASSSKKVEDSPIRNLSDAQIKIFLIELQKKGIVPEDSPTLKAKGDKISKFFNRASKEGDTQALFIYRKKSKKTLSFMMLQLQKEAQRRKIEQPQIDYQFTEDDFRQGLQDLLQREEIVHMEHLNQIMNSETSSESMGSKFSPVNPFTSKMYSLKDLIVKENELQEEGPYILNIVKDEAQKELERRQKPADESLDANLEKHIADLKLNRHGMPNDALLSDFLNANSELNRRSQQQGRELNLEDIYPEDLTDPDIKIDEMRDGSLKLFRDIAQDELKLRNLDLNSQDSFKIGLKYILHRDISDETIDSYLENFQSLSQGTAAESSSKQNQYSYDILYNKGAAYVLDHPQELSDAVKEATWEVLNEERKNRDQIFIIIWSRMALNF